jgi:DNA polymerase/3'-5' exonuclease PolX
LELDCVQSYKIGAYRKAAWTIDELQENISDIYAQKGRRGLEGIKNIGKSLSEEIELEIKNL